MAKKARTKTKMPPGADEGGPTPTGPALGDLVAERVKAMASRMEEIIEDAPAKARERIKPIVEKLLAKWHEVRGDEPTADAAKPAARSKAKRKRAPQKTKAAKPVTKAVKARSASTGKAKPAKKRAKKKA
jgi:hypothetical protein